MKYKNWFITGGLGFIGLNLVKYLKSLDNSVNIRILDNESVGSFEALTKICKVEHLGSPFRVKPLTGKGTVEYIHHNVLNTTWEQLLNIDVLVHLAAQTSVPESLKLPYFDAEINVLGTIQALKAASSAGVKKVIFASSSAVAGNIDPPMHELMPTNPVSPYGVSKLAGEKYCAMYSNLYDLSTIVLRFSNVFGPFSNTKESVVAKFIRKAFNDEVLEVCGDGNQTRDFIYIDDLCNAILATSKLRCKHEIFQVATGIPTTIQELVEHLIEIFDTNLGKKIKVKYVKERTGDIKYNYSNISKIKKMTGWNPNTDFRTQLIKTIEHFWAYN